MWHQVKLIIKYSFEFCFCWITVFTVITTAASLMASLAICFPDSQAEIFERWNVPLPFVVSSEHNLSTVLITINWAPLVLLLYCSFLPLPLWGAFIPLHVEKRQQAFQQNRSPQIPSSPPCALITGFQEIWDPPTCSALRRAMLCAGICSPCAVLSNRTAATPKHCSVCV